MTVFRVMNTERVIHEVKTRECLWNPRNLQYKNKLEKYKAWEEVSEAVLPKFATCNEYEQSRIVRAVQSRWKTARDAYMKCRLTDVKKPTYKSKQHKYIYQEQLRFLEQVKDIDEIRSKDEDETSNSFGGENSASQSAFGVSDDDETSDGVMDFDIDTDDDFKIKIEEVITAVEDDSGKAISIDTEKSQSVPGTSSQNNDKITPIAAIHISNPSFKRLHNAQPRKFKSKLTEFETRLLKVLRLKNTTRPDTSALQADDQFFFDSLVPFINNFDNHQKLKFRSKILEAVMAVRNVSPVNVKQEIETYVFEDLDDIKN